MRIALCTLGATVGLVAQSMPETRTPRAPVTTADVKWQAAAVVKDAAPLPTPRRVPTAIPGRPDAAAAPVPPLAAQDFLLFDTPGDGNVWVVTADWKARIGAAGAEFAPCLGPTAAGTARVALELVGATVAGEPLALRTAAPQQRDRAVTLDRGTVLERYDVLANGLEQSFVFATLPRRGEVRVEIALRTPLAVAVDADGDALSCLGADGGVRVADAVAFDARGVRRRLAMQYDAGTLRLTVPADFVAEAVLPLTVDPTISPIVFVVNPVRLERPDIAYDPSLAEYFAIWQRDFSAIDRDVYAWRLDAGAQSVGPMLAVDVTFDSWEYPRVANCDFADNFLTVAQVSYSGGPTWIGGRLGSPGGMGAQFVVEQAGLPGHLVGAKLFPDVGGDPSAFGPVYYTVVWERVWSATDHDVHMKQVDTAGALRSAAPTVLENSYANTSHPRIGKSDGRWGALGSTSQFWPVVWQRTFSATDEDVYGMHLTWDGQPATSPFAVSVSGADERDPVASSPTDEVTGTRHTLFAWARYDAVTSWDVIAAYHAANGQQLGAVNVNVAEGVPVWAANPQWNAAVDCDGLRFAVGYTEDFVQATHLDTRCSLLAWDDVTASLVVQEPRVWFGQTYGQEDHIAIVAQGAAGGSSAYYGVVYDLDDTAGTFGICAHPYTGYANQPLPSTRLTGCGSLGITLNDLPMLDSTITVTQTDSGPATGFVFGYPVSAPLGFCPGCELGVDGFLTPNPMTWTVPAVPAYVGIELSVQAWSLLGGPCLGSIAMSNTIDFRLL